MPQFLRCQVHGTGPNASHSRHHSQDSNAHNKLHKADSGGPDTAGKVYLEGCPYESQK